MTTVSPTNSAASSIVGRIAGENALLAPELTPELTSLELMELGRLLLEGVDRIGALGACLQMLDELLVTGRPPAIADAARVVELSLSTAQPLFHEICTALDNLGTPRLQAASTRLCHADQATAAAAECLSADLKRFAKRNAAYHRRAEGLSRGLTASLRTLHALGMAGSGRLLAEA